MDKQQLNFWRAGTWIGIIGLVIAFWSAVIILIKETFFTFSL